MRLLTTSTAHAAFLALALLAALPLPARLAAQSDLDALMRRVLARRDDNWKKLQQYVLDEREAVELRGESGTIWGERREYRWFLRDGFFVRSPTKVNGVDVSESERQQYEADFFRRAQERDRRTYGRGAAPTPPPVRDGDGPPDVASLIRQSRDPQFVSSAYFLRFRFEEGTYALVGREQLEGRDVLRVEYYPTNLYRQGRRGPGRLGSNPVDTETRRLLNKVALVTLWIDPALDQIVKYTFDNVDLDFLPAQWLVRVNGVRATMTMTQAFPEVWLPSDLEMNVALGFATGEFTLHYQLAYRDYRQADVNSTLHVPKDR
jgi:hypothetical protein